MWRNVSSVPIEVDIASCPITRRTRPFSLARDDAADPGWRARVHREHGWMLAAMQEEFKRDKGIDYTPPSHQHSDAMYWNLHGVVACHFNRAEESSRAYRESLQMDANSSLAARILHSLGKVYLGQGKFAEAEHVLQLAEDRVQLAEDRMQLAEGSYDNAGGGQSSDGYGLSSFRAQLRMLRLHAAAQGETTDAVQQMAELLCAQLGSLAKLASIRGWTGASCRTATRDWESSFAGRGAFSTDARATFKRSKYVLLSAVLPPRLLEGFLQPWYRWLAIAPLATTRRALAGYELRWLAKRQRYELLHEPVAEMLNIMLATLSAAISRVALVPSYAFPIRYPSGGFVEWHIDQKDNELSLSLQVEITPADSGWPLYFIDYNTTVRPGLPPPKEISLDPWHVETAAVLTARNNQGVLYKGQELVHYRPALPAGLELMQIVFAWRLPNEESCNG